MANTVLSPIMSMPVPVPGTDPGPQYAFDLNSCLSILDQHDHTTGLGNPITPNALLINADLPMGSNNIKALLAAQFTVQTPATSLLGALSVSGVDLWYTDVNGNKIQITASGGVAGTPGAIANLVSPASASYVAGSKTFVWQSNVNQAANLDAASIILRNIPGTNGLTLSPPALGSNYTITLPTLPGSPSFLSIDSSGTMGDAIPLSQGITGSNIANATITGSNIAASTIDQSNMNINSVGTAQLIDSNVTPVKLAAYVQQGGSGSGVFSTTSGTYTIISELTITVSGLRPVMIVVSNYDSGTPGYFSVNDGSNPPRGQFEIKRDTAVLLQSELASPGPGQAISIPASMIIIDFPSAGAHSYKLLGRVVSSPTTVLTANAVVIQATEL